MLRTPIRLDIWISVLNSRSFRDHLVLSKTPLPPDQINTKGRLFRLLFQYSFNFCFQLWNIGFDNIPDNVEINTKIIMDYFIPNIPHLSPGNGRIFFFKSWIYLIAGFPNYFKTSTDGLYKPFIYYKFIKRITFILPFKVITFLQNMS